MSRKRINTLLKVLGLIAVLVVISQVVFPIINSPDFEDFVRDIGPFGPFVIILFTLIGHVFLPFAGSPVLLISLAIYGAIQTSLFLYVASMFGAIINFELARQYGKKLIRKVAGQDSIDQIDIFSRFTGEKALVVARLFGFPFFEIISYAAGLTNISFRNYILITALVGAIPNLSIAFLFRNAELTDPINFYIWLAVLVLLGLGFSLAMKQYHDKHMS